MIVTSIKTPIVKPNDNLLAFLRKNITALSEESVLVITSKIISYCQGRMVPKPAGIKDKSYKHQLAKQEADFYLEPSYSQYNMLITIKDKTVAVNAGLDESNADGYYLLWPDRPQQAANHIWHFLRQHFNLKKVGVIITDSKTMPLIMGVVGTAIAHCGFLGLYDYRGKKDLFGRKLKMSRMNICEAVATAAVMEMGEADESRPLAIARQLPKIIWQDRAPNQQEINELKIDIADDVYGPFLTSVNWKSKPKI